MTRKIHMAWAVLLTAALGPWAVASAQDGCLNENRYPLDAVTPDRAGEVTSIAPCSYLREYSQVTGVRATGEYMFTVTQDGYITVRDGAVDGAVLGQGTSPLTVTAQTSSDLYVHWNVDAECGQATDCVETTVQLLLSCTLPAATYTTVEDCDLGGYTVNLDVTSVGDGSSVDVLVYRNGDVETHSGVGVGALVLGPFLFGELPTVTLVHASDPFCDLELGAVEPRRTCPMLITCGATPVVETYCYTANDDRSWTYSSVGDGSLNLRFLRGTIESSTYDRVRIYDGPDASFPELFAHAVTARRHLGPAGSATSDPAAVYYAVDVTATGNTIHMVVTSDGSVECGTDEYDPWEWVVLCRDCDMPVVRAAVVSDCLNGQYSVDVNVTSVGDAGAIRLSYSVNGGPAAYEDDVEVGIHTIGPFAITDTVDMAVEHPGNELCNFPLGRIVHTVMCPDLVPCSAPALEQEYCYGANENRRWMYRLTGGTEDSRLRLSFVRGTIESSTYDRVRIFDGPDETYPELFAHTTAARRHLGPVGSAIADAAPVYSTVEVAATGEYISMLLTTDGSVQCGTDGYDPWEWLVYCVDCDNPGAAFSITADCPARGYAVQVDITDAGGADALSVVNLTTGEVQAGLGVGSYIFGPYPLDSVNVLRVYNEATEMCRTTSASLVEPSADCIDVTCGVDHHSYCYGNDEDRWYTYRAEGNRVMNLLFTAGQLLTGDRIILYNGLDATADVLYNGNNGGDLAGLVVMSSNPDNAITLRIQSNDAGSCDDGGATTPLQWTVSCGGVGIDELAAGAFTMFPNPTSGLLTIQAAVPVTKAQVRVLDMSGRVVMDQPLTMNGGDRNTIDMSRLQNGNYMVQVITTDGVMTQRVEMIR